MADIDVRRRGPSIWPWIVGLVVLALVVWLLAETLGHDEPIVADRIEQVGGEPAPPPPGVRLVSA